MQNSVLSNILSLNDITEVLNNSFVKENKDKLSTQKVVNFSVSLPDIIKNKLKNSLSLDLSQVLSIPMRWIKGDTISHIDTGEAYFNTTYLIYITDSVGGLIVDGVTYPIVAGDAHIFSEGLTHSTFNTGNDARLMIGPMSESGFVVKGASNCINYYNNLSDAISAYNGGTDNNIYTSQNTIVSIPPNNLPQVWFIYDNSGSTIPPSPNNVPYNTGDTLIPTGLYYIYPYIAPISNVCFPAKTPITTDQGIIPIEKINPLLHTIRSKKIIEITKTITRDKYLICFEQNAIDVNIPSEKTFISMNHLIFNKGKMIKAKDFIGKYDNIYKVNYMGEILYNILLEDYDTMNVNNLICETLHPDNEIAKLYKILPNYSIEKQCQIIDKYNHSIVTRKKHFPMPFTMSKIIRSSTLSNVKNK